jgi:mercuric ion transport protein
MNSPERLPNETHKPITGYLWGALAVLTCPCHLPILAIVLAGTTAGAFIGEHWGVAALALTGLFVLSVTRLLRAFMENHERFPTNKMDGHTTSAGSRARAIRRRQVEADYSGTVE